MTLPPQAPLTSRGRPQLRLSQVRFLGAPHETLYKSPLIFRKVKCYYAFNEEVTPTCMGVHVSTDDLVPRHGQGKPALAFSPCKVLSRLTCFSSACPSPFPSFSGAGHQEADLGGGARTVAGFPPAVGPGPATLKQSLSARSWAGEEQSWQPPGGKECYCYPLSPLPACCSCHPRPRSPATESPPDKDFTLHSGVRGQTLAMSGERGG